MQELHTVTRLVPSFALGKAFGAQDTDAGMEQLLTRHRDTDHGGYVWSADDTGVADGTRLAYSHVLVLLAASSAVTAGRSEARRSQSIRQPLGMHEPRHGRLRRSQSDLGGTFNTNGCS
ncbi:AGE family epimerase/isomerase [Falsirhodobacter sp. 20TX0035]|uniref:AGE family epimerase/isomerase n=1 Tax=Falsirhodobacter sp. 20TX0035 TaxID=3022019 RepID=UPI00232D1058|nr:AGE family epimerase/isomerase [Falsirhodobacter sp. 20TX0035]MDB6453691.1 AGE family epimerase/isomerase [Falsirhodobacter sp. 20TX0035]